MRDLTDASRAASMGPFLESKYSSRLNVEEEVVEATCSVVVDVDVIGDETSLAGVNADTHCKEEVIAAQRAAALMMREERCIVLVRIVVRVDGDEEYAVCCRRQQEVE